MNNRRKNLHWQGGFVLSVIGVLGLVSLSAGATSVIPMNKVDVAKRAGCIVQAVALDKTVRWSHGDGGIILTETLLEVEDCLKGKYEGGDILTVRTLGGRLDGIVSAVPGMPHFKVGEAYVLFLNANPPSEIDEKSFTSPVSICTGLTQGQYQIFTDEKTGQQFVARDLAGTEFPLGIFPKAQESRPTLEQFKQEIVTILENLEEEAATNEE